MSARKYLNLLLLVATMAMMVGCKQASSNARTRAIGRTAQGAINNYSGQYSSLQPNSRGTTWGQVVSSQGDQAFDSQLYYMTLPMLSGAEGDQQLGYVSASPNSDTGVMFWGEASMYGAGGGGYAGYGGGNGVLDGSRARIHIEIWDDKAVRYGVSPVVLDIGYDFPGFTGAQGTVSGSNVNLVFQNDSYGAIALQGQISGNFFTGTMYFQNGNTGGQFYSIGNFQVEACGFFVCN